MEHFIARQRVTQGGKSQFTGKFDADGEPVIRRVAQSILPGCTFVPCPQDKGWLLEQNAIRPMTASELALFEKGKRDGFSINEGGDGPTFQRESIPGTDWSKISERLSR